MQNSVFKFLYEPFVSKFKILNLSLIYGIIKVNKNLRFIGETMSYILKQYDTPLIKFNINKDAFGISTEILLVNEEKRNLLPLSLNKNLDNLSSWLRHRTIPSNRAFVENFLAKLGLNEKDTKGIIDICKGLSLNDSYWIVDENFKGTFANNNLYDNRFSQTLSLMAFTGYGSYVKSTFRSSPEFTTGGMLAKCWRRVNGKILLYKSGTQGFANSGKEPYSEYYAYQIAETMGLDFVKYNLSKWKGYLCSTCELFTDKDTSYIPVAYIVNGNNLKDILVYYKKLGEKYYNSLVSMLVFDAIICNTDRHLGNFGFLVDNKENKIIGTAPIFDNGLSLFCYAMEDDIENLDKYAETRTPALYENFVDVAKELITPIQQEQLKRLIGFKFKKHSRYNLDKNRLKAIENFIQKRVLELLN